MRVSAFCRGTLLRRYGGEEAHAVAARRRPGRVRQPERVDFGRACPVEASSLVGGLDKASAPTNTSRAGGIVDHLMVSYHPQTKLQRSTGMFTLNIRVHGPMSWMSAHSQRNSSVQ
jgi:hypothetical protein